MNRFNLVLVFFSVGSLSTAQTQPSNLDLGWLITLADSIQNETEICNSCMSLPEIRSYITPGGLQRYRLRYECDLQTSTTLLYDEDGGIVGACIIDPENRNCDYVTEFTGYTFGRNITTIWTCTGGFDCQNAPRSLLFPSYAINIFGDPCDNGLQRLEVSEPFNRYLWTAPDGATGSESTFIADAPGQYELIVFEENDCADTSYLMVDDHSEINPVISGPTALCNDDGVLLSIEGYDHMLWSNGKTVNTILVTEPGEISVIVSNELYCSDTAIVFITDARDQSMRIEMNSSVIYAGQKIVLSLGTEGMSTDDLNDVRWTYDSEEITGTLELTIEVDQPITISVSAISSAGCQIRDEIFLDPLPVNRKIYIPTAFNPMSKDGNERFVLHTIEGTIQLREMTVYNRWGSPVYSSSSQKMNDQLSGWDGRHKGVLLPMGIYIYSAEVEYADDTSELLRGSVLLIY